jgi:5-(carboxyamino)imidazole ribonucleotide synthase
MTHQAAISLGIDVHVLSPDAGAPAVLAGAHHLAGHPDRLEDLLHLAEGVDVVTLDHEQAPADLLAELVAGGHRVAPGAAAARLGQDKAAARAVLGPRGIPTAPWLRSRSLAEIEAFADEHRWPVVVKAPTGGYDGRGVWRATSLDDVREIIDHLDGDLLVEPVIDFSNELAVMVVRSSTGETVAYPPVETVQLGGRCHEVFAPAGVAPALATRARSLAVSIAQEVDLVGTMAVELFVADGELLLNELAVRPHNSGHLTIEACATSQFENHLRAVLGLPLGATDLIVPAASMVNVVGDDDGGDPFDRVAAALAVPGVSVHCYGKGARPGRKLGHLTATGADLASARATAERAADALAAPSPTGERRPERAA